MVQHSKAELVKKWHFSICHNNELIMERQNWTNNLFLVKANVYSDFYSSSLKLNKSSLAVNNRSSGREQVWHFRHSKTDELQDELCFSAAIFLRTHLVPGCKPWGVSHKEMKPGSSFQPRACNGRQVEPFQPSLACARKTDSVNVCLCVRII